MNQIVCKMLPCVEDDNINNWWKFQVYIVICFKIATRYEKSINGNSLGITVV